MTKLRVFAITFRFRLIRWLAGNRMVVLNATVSGTVAGPMPMIGNVKFQQASSTDVTHVLEVAS